MGPARTVFRRPASVAIAGLLGVENVFDAQIAEGGSVVVPAQAGAGAQDRPCAIRACRPVRAAS